MATEIKYNGEVIASPEAGQTATLKCAGMKMESDVVVEVAEMPEGGGSNANIVPLTVTENGTFDDNYIEIVTEAFESGREPNAIYNYFGMYQLPYIKANKLVANGIVNAIDEGKVSYNIGGEIYTVTSDGIRTNADKTFVAVDYQTMMPMVLWVITPDDTYYTTEAGFESNSVYILDGWSAGMLGEDVAASVTTLGISDKKVDGYMPVQVQLPIIDKLVIEPSISGGTFIGDGYYRKVEVGGMVSRVYTITPTGEKQVIRQSDLRNDEYIAQVTVNPMDFSDLSNKNVLCGIYLDPLPKTEYKVGEWLNVDDGVLVRKYTDGTTTSVNLTADLVYGFGTIVNTIGTHKLTVKYTENGVTSETVFWVKITE